MESLCRLVMLQTPAADALADAGKGYIIYG